MHSRHTNPHAGVSTRRADVGPRFHTHSAQLIRCFCDPIPNNLIPPPFTPSPDVAASPGPKPNARSASSTALRWTKSPKRSRVGSATWSFAPPGTRGSRLGTCWRRGSAWPGRSANAPAWGMARGILSTFSPPHRPMEFDERHFPYEYECVDCGTTATIEHDDVQDVPSLFPSVAKAVEYVIRHRRGWMIALERGPICPECMADSMNPTD